MSEENKSFSYSYYGAINEELEHIKEKYTKKDVNEKMNKIRAIDNKVDFISTMLSIFSGLIGTCFLISGTIGIIKGFSETTISIVAISLGIFLISAAPFMHKKIYNKIKAHYAPKILSLIEEIEQNQL